MSDLPPPLADGPQSGDPRRRTLDEVVERFLADLRSGVRPDRAFYVSQYPEFGARLDRRLTFVEAVFAAVQAGASRRWKPNSEDQTTDASTESLGTGSRAGQESGSAAGNGSALRIEHTARMQCPHCGNRIQIVESVVDEVTCKVCGSTFHIESVAPTLPPPAKRPWPKRLGKFEIIELLGRGGFGVVFKARDPDLDRIVAVKTPRSGYFVSDEEERRFMREARAAARLRHANIVPVHDVSHDAAAPLIVSDFIDGLTLADLVSVRRLEFRESAELVAQIADALDYAHREGVIHRDVKPSNILIDHCGRPHLADFGLARRDEGEITITLEGEVLGTLTYMSPEQAAGENQRVDGRTDIYSLGVILYRLLTGNLPFRGSKRMLIHQILRDEPKPLRGINESVPRDLETICLKAMQKEIPKRYGTARELADDLRSWLSNEPIQARPISRWERTWRWCRKNPAVASLLGALYLVLAAALVAGMVWARREQELRGLAETARREEVRQRGIAESHATESRARLARLSNVNGSSYLQDGHPFAALLWFAEAWALEKHQPQRDEIHRLRAATLLRQTPKLSQIIFHGGELKSGKVSADNRTILIASNTGRIALWNRLTGAGVGQAWQYGGDVYASDMSPDGALYGVAGFDNAVRLRKTSADEFLGAPLPHGAPVTELEFNAAGTRLATACQDKLARIWQIPDGKLLFALQHTEELRRVAFSPDGQWLVTVSCHVVGRPGEARAWNVETGDQIGVSLTVADYVRSLEFSPTGQACAMALDNGNAVLWKAPFTETSVQLFPHGEQIFALAFSGDGERLATGGADARVKTWNVHTGLPVGGPLEHADSILAIRMSKSGEVVFTGCADGTARGWNVASTVPVTPKLPQHAGISWIDLSADERWLTTFDLSGIAKVWDLSGIPLSPIRLPHDDAVTRVALDEGSRMIATAGQDGTAAVWNARSGELVARTPKQSSPIMNVAIRPGGREFATCEVDGRIRWFALPAGDVSRPDMRHAMRVDRINFNSTGSHAVSASADQTAGIWNVDDGQLVASITHQGEVNDAVFSHDDQFIATASDDRSISVHRADTGQAVTEPLVLPGIPLRVVFSRDGQRVASFGFGSQSNSNGLSVIWNWSNPTQTIRLPHTRPVWHGGFSADNRHFLTACLDGVVRVWQSDTGRLVWSAAYDSSHEIGTAAFAANSPVTLATSWRGLPRIQNLGWGDGALAFFDSTTGDPVSLPLWQFGKVFNGLISTDGRTVVIATADRGAKLFQLSPFAESEEVLRDVAEVYSGQKYVPFSGLVPLFLEELQSRWQKVRTRHPEFFQAADADLQSGKLFQFVSQNPRE